MKATSCRFLLYRGISYYTTLSSCKKALKQKNVLYTPKLNGYLIPTDNLVLGLSLAEREQAVSCPLISKCVYFVQLRSKA